MIDQNDSTLASALLSPTSGPLRSAQLDFINSSVLATVALSKLTKTLSPEELNVWLSASVEVVRKMSLSAMETSS